MILDTLRLILRPWREEDAEALYKYAKDPRVGPVAGWQAHTGVENSREIIRNVLSGEHTFAVVDRETDEPVGSIGLMIGAESNIGITEQEGEIGYWVGAPYWGRGFIPEAVLCMLRYGFETCGLRRIWCGYFDGNRKSRRVQEKCGFRYHHTSHGVSCFLPDETRTEHVTCMTREQWLQWESVEECRRSLMVLDRRDYTEDMPVFERDAVRAVIRRDGKIAVQRSSRGDCKLLGGGVDEGEHFTDTLCREVEEEAGLVVKRDTIRGIGQIEEMHRDIFGADQMFHCHSFYFTCETEPGQVPVHMTDSELAKGYHLEWVTPEELIAANEPFLEDFWIERDTAFVKQELLKN